MTLPATKPWTPEEFLAWEERQPLRYEFDGLQPAAMTGGTAAHATVLERGETVWTVHLLMKGALLRLPEAGSELPLEELYEGIAFRMASGEPLPDAT